MKCPKCMSDMKWLELFSSADWFCEKCEGEDERAGEEGVGPDTDTLDLNLDGYALWDIGLCAKNMEMYNHLLRILNYTSYDFMIGGQHYTVVCVARLKNCDQIQLLSGDYTYNFVRPVGTVDFWYKPERWPQHSSTP